MLKQARRSLNLPRRNLLASDWMINAMKATLKSSTEKKQPIESTTPNNEVLPKLRSTLSARNIMLGPNYDEEINKTVVCLY
ncbi:unnamed protein product [Malus baccata var. baccata]